jgi:hypothetical protein
MILQPLLPNADAGRGTRRRGMRWTKRTMTVTKMLEADASKAGDTTAVAEGQREAQERFLELE